MVAEWLTDNVAVEDTDWPGADDKVRDAGVRRGAEVAGIMRGSCCLEPVGLCNEGTFR